MTILGIETSCDETSIALLKVSAGTFKLQKHVTASQIKIHTKYGGVVPEIAARQHLEALQPMLSSHIGRTQFQRIDQIAVTAGPGLITSLMVGVQEAKTLSYVTGKPLVGINHLEAHIYSNWLSHLELFQDSKKYFPALVLIVSGGHTELIIMKGHGQYMLLGQTLDDAAGESFDKVAKILDLGYPGGPILSKLAEYGNPKAIMFPRPMSTSAGYAMSFSGLKTAVLYFLEKKKQVSKKEMPDIAASFQAAVIDSLMAKVQRALKEYTPRSLMLAGGVAANKALRSSFIAEGKKNEIPVFVPDLEFTGDNAAMIAMTGYFRRKNASKNTWRTLRFDPQLPFVK